MHKYNDFTGIFFAGDKVMRQVLNTVVATLLVLLTVPASIGVHLTSCEHSGKISFASFHDETDCGMSSDNSCMKHLQIKLSDYSSEQEFHLVPVVMPLMGFISILLPSPAVVMSFMLNQPTDHAPPGKNITLPMRN